MKFFKADMEKSALLLSAMANSTRLEILKILLENEVSVGELAKMLNISQSPVSQHLAKLRAQNLVKARRDRQTVYYSSDSNAVRSMLKALDSILGDTTSSAASKSKAARRTISS